MRNYQIAQETDARNGGTAEGCVTRLFRLYRAGFDLDCSLPDITACGSDALNIEFALFFGGCNHPKSAVGDQNLKAVERRLPHGSCVPDVVSANPFAGRLFAAIADPSYTVSPPGLLGEIADFVCDSSSRQVKKLAVSIGLFRFGVL